MSLTPEDLQRWLDHQKRADEHTPAPPDPLRRVRG